jgi:hypothetical protein
MIASAWSRSVLTTTQYRMSRKNSLHDPGGCLSQPVLGQPKTPSRGHLGCQEDAPRRGRVHVRELRQALHSPVDLLKDQIDMLGRAGPGQVPLQCLDLTLRSRRSRWRRRVSSRPVEYSIRCGRRLPQQQRFSSYCRASCPLSLPDQDLKLHAPIEGPPFLGVVISDGACFAVAQGRHAVGVNLVA